jgi:glutamine amidotransferase
MLTILDCKIGNLKAFTNIFESLRIPYYIATKGLELTAASKILLPGVGAFDTAMENLEKLDFLQPLNDLVIDKKTPFLGICIGMQIIANSSDEGSREGLGWIEGKVKLLPESSKRIPHMGWNSVSFKQESSLEENLNFSQGFYFLHSYFFELTNKSHILCETEYNSVFASAVKKENVVGVQFHPEKSHSNGESLLQNFSERFLC